MGEKVNFNALTNVMQHLIGSCQILRWYILRYTVSNTMSFWEVASLWLTSGFTLLKALALGAKCKGLDVKMPKSALKWGQL